MVDSASDVNRWVTQGKIVLSYLIALNAKLMVTYQPSVLQRDSASTNRTNDVKVSLRDLTQSTKLAENNGKKHKTSPSFPTKTISVLIVLVNIKPVTAPKDINIKHQPLATLLMAQVLIRTLKFLTIFKIINCHNISNKVHPLLVHELLP